MRSVLSSKLTTIKPKLQSIFSVFVVSTFVYLWIFEDFSYPQKGELLEENVADLDLFEVVKFNASVRTHRFSKFSNVCLRPELDPWDTSIRQYMKPSWVLWSKCVPEMQHVAYLKDFRVHINSTLRKPLSTCATRCLHAYSDNQIQTSPWVFFDEISDVVPCDVVEVKCVDDFNGTYYNYIFSQVYPVKDVQERQNKTDRPNVFVIVIDATSASNFARTLSKTRNFLLDELKAVEFKYLNKVGVNSMPNSRAFMAGKMFENQPETPTNKQLVSDYLNDDESCYDYSNNDSYVAFDFHKAGYITCQAEETSVYGYNGCLGFMGKPVDHYWSPFGLRLERDKTGKLTDNMFNKSCLEWHHHNINYLDKFLYSYPDKSKFIFSWFTEPAHGNINGLFHADEDFFQFFERNKQEMDDSYVFLMSDHGLHYTDIVYTEVGQIELNNPFLMVSLPRKMRGSPTHERLKINSHELVTHFDTHATLVDIVDDYLSQEDIRRLPVHGSSLFKRLAQPRTCNHLNVMHQFCLCQPLLTPVVNSALSIRIGRTLVKHMNQQVDHWFSKKLCKQLTLDEWDGVKMEKIENLEQVDFYKVTFQANPNHLEFYSNVWIDPLDHSKLSIVGEILRKNYIMDDIGCTKYIEAKIFCVCL